MVDDTGILNLAKQMWYAFVIEEGDQEWEREGNPPPTEEDWENLLIDEQRQRWIEHARHVCNLLVMPTPQQGGLTDDELRAMDLTSQLSNLLRRIIKHPTVLSEQFANEDSDRQDWNEVAVMIHALQHIILAQCAARTYPDKFRLMGARFRIRKA